MTSPGASIYEAQYPMPGRTVTTRIIKLGGGRYRIEANNGARPIEWRGAAAAYRTLALMERINTATPGMRVSGDLLEVCSIAVTSPLSSRRGSAARAIAWVVERVGLENLRRIRNVCVELMPDAIQAAHAQDAVAWQSR